MHRKRLRVALAIAGGVCAVVSLMAPQARAFTLTVNSVVKLGGNTASGVFGGSNRHTSYDSAVSILDGGGTAADTIGSTADGKTRYASTQTADDNGLLAGGADLTATGSYQVNFTVSTTYSGETYDLQIDTSRIGAFVIHNEGTAGANNSMGAVAGTFTAPTQGLTSLAGLGGLNQRGDGVSPFNQTGTNTITGLTGTQSFTLTFNWTGDTHSANGLSNASESVILMGMDTRLNGDVGSADDYPGQSGRTAAGDGHFVSITAKVTAVPEPSTMALAGIGLVGGVIAAWRRRRAA